MTKFFNKFKKNSFWPILGPFSQILGHVFSPKNPALLCTTSYRFLAPCQNLEKTSDTIPMPGEKEGWTERWMEGRTDPIL